MIDDNKVPELILEPRWEGNGPDAKLMGFNVMNGQQVIGTMRITELMFALEKWGTGDEEA